MGVHSIIFFLDYIFFPIFLGKNLYDDVGIPTYYLHLSQLIRCSLLIQLNKKTNSREILHKDITLSLPSSLSAHSGKFAEAGKF